MCLDHVGSARDLWAVFKLGGRRNPDYKNLPDIFAGSPATTFCFSGFARNDHAGIHFTKESSFCAVYLTAGAHGQPAECRSPKGPA